MLYFFDESKVSWSRALCLFLLGLSSLSTQAAALIDQQPLANGSTLQTEHTGGFEYADNFGLASSSSLTGFKWWGGYFGGDDSAGDDFLVTLYSDLGGLPGSAPLSVDVGSGATRSSTALVEAGGDSVFLYEFSLAAPVALASGTYHIAVDNRSGADWLWLSSSDGDGAISYRDTGGIWDAFPDIDMSFTVLGERQSQPVPEPTVPALLAVAGLALLAARRRVSR